MRRPNNVTYIYKSVTLIIKLFILEYEGQYFKQNGKLSVTEWTIEDKDMNCIGKQI